jgi:S1-C subfamily serine protease
LIGVLSLNYSRSRWLGTAVPINDLKPLIYPQSCWLDDEEEKLPVYWGIRLEQRGSEEIRVLSVREGSPAAEAGLAAGDRIRAVDGCDTETLREFRKARGSMEPEGEVTLKVVRGGEGSELKIRPWRRF